MNKNLNYKIIKKIIICPNCKSNKIFYKKKYLFCKLCAEKYPIIFGIPVLISKKKRIKLYNYKGSIEKKIFRSKCFKLNKNGVLKYVEQALASTSGFLYEDVKNIKEYPIALIPFPFINRIIKKKKLMLDMGCGWGRWTINAAQKGYETIGVDISLSSLIAAKMIAKKFDLKNCYFICCDVMNLPFKRNIFDIVFSFSFLQHFSEKRLKIILLKISLILKKKGIFKTQMVNKYSLRGLYNILRFKFFKKEMQKRGYIDKNENENNFDVRYFSIIKLYRLFNEYFLVTKIKNYSFFTQAQLSDYKILTIKSKFYLLISFTFNFISKYIFFFKYFTDNIILTLRRKY